MGQSVLLIFHPSILTFLHSYILVRKSRTKDKTTNSNTTRGGKVPVQCIFWARGYCRNEEKCRFLHEAVTAAAAPASAATNDDAKKVENEAQ